MLRKSISVLVVDDQDMDCKKKLEDRTLEDIKLSSVGFLLSDLEKYDLIVYKGKLGQKILRLRGI